MRTIFLYSPMMDDAVVTNNNYSLPWMQRLREKIFRWVRLTNRPVVKVYNGYGGNGQIVVYGHILRLSPLPRKKYRRNIWTNTLALIRLFMVKPIPLARVEAEFYGDLAVNTCERDGFFRLRWTPREMPPPGWHRIKVKLAEGVVRKYYGAVYGTGEIYIPHSHQYAIISDIDDTFLISHSSNFRKRLFVLMTENAHSRQPFDGVVKHYQLLSLAGTVAAEPNPFFYVSSSEWNLYDYIVDFSRKNKLPRGIYLLNQIKRLTQAWKTGQNKHGTKFTRIVRILQAFPEHRFILLGDDSQQDPFIYASVVRHFPQQIRVVYLRNVFQKNRERVEKAIEETRSWGVDVCHFRHSAEAIEHSVKIGLIPLNR